MKLTRYALAATMLLFGLASGCADETNTSSSSYSCCVNGSFYACESSAAVQKCSMSDFSGCDRDSSKDDAECSD